MSKKINLKMLSEKLNKGIVNKTESLVKNDILPAYFSPRRTRNQTKELLKSENSKFKDNSLVKVNKIKEIKSSFFPQTNKNESSKYSEEIDSSHSIAEDIEVSEEKIAKNTNRKHIKLKYEESDEHQEIQESSGIRKRKLFPPNEIIFPAVPIPSSSSNTSRKKNSHSNKNDQDLTLIPIKQEKWEPENWKDILENIKIMRRERPAAVDTMGCDKCSDPEADEKTQRYHSLVALMLSSQTKDEVTYACMNRLKPKNLTPKTIVEMNLDELEKLLYPVSFYKTKAKNLKKTANILIEKYDSDIPQSFAGLIELPGVGPKMAHICMRSAWNIVSGIGVDVHVHRISNRLKWVKDSTKTPEQTRVVLESWLPHEYWNEVNGLLVGFGQTICTPVKPKCDECLNNKLCPSAFKVTKNKK